MKKGLGLGKKSAGRFGGGNSCGDGSRCRSGSGCGSGKEKGMMQLTKCVRRTSAPAVKGNQLDHLLRTPRGLTNQDESVTIDNSSTENTIGSSLMPSS